MINCFSRLSPCLNPIHGHKSIRTVPTISTRLPLCRTLVRTYASTNKDGSEPQLRNATHSHLRLCSTSNHPDRLPQNPSHRVRNTKSRNSETSAKEARHREARHRGIVRAAFRWKQEGSDAEHEILTPRFQYLKTLFSPSKWPAYYDQPDLQRSQAKQVWLANSLERWKFVKNPKTGRFELTSGWHYYMDWALKEKPLRALIPLDLAIHFAEIRPYTRHLRDCLSALAVRLLDTASPRVSEVDAVHRLLCDYAGVVSKLEKPYPVHQHTILLVLKACSHEQRKSLFRTLLTHNLPLTSSTLFQFATKFLDESEVLIGLEILRSAINIGASMSSMPTQSCCVKILRTCREGQDLGGLHSDSLTQMLGMGIEPNIILWTCIMMNEIELGNLSEVWRWYDKGIQDGLKPDKITFSILLKAANKALSDDFLNRVIEDATKERVLPDNLNTIFDILHTICLIEQSKAVEGFGRPFDAMLQFYSQYCDVRPLQELGICPEHYAMEGFLGREVQTPPPRMVGIMLMGYLYQYGQEAPIPTLYLRYHNLVEADHPIIAPTRSTDYVSNAFIKTLGVRSDQLNHCTLVVKNMLDSECPAHYVTEAFGNTNPGQTGKPTVQTWSILLHSYMMHGHTEAAEKILPMMRSRGIEPNVVTWNHIIAGYVKSQDVENVIRASKQMKEEHHEYDEFTIQALRNLVDKTRYMEAMESPSTDNAEISIASGAERETTETSWDNKNMNEQRSTQVPLPVPLPGIGEPPARVSPLRSSSVSSSQSKGDTKWMDQEMEKHGSRISSRGHTDPTSDAFTAVES